jgi:hypothetical protein
VRQASQSSSSFLVLIVSAAGLCSTTYRQIALEAANTRKALLIVLLAAAAHGVADVIRAIAFGWDPATSWVFGVQGEVVFWFLGSTAASVVGRVFQTTPRFWELLRSWGFAAAPAPFIIIASFVSVFSTRAGLVALLIVGAWRLAATYTATREALNLKPLRASIVTSCAIVLGALGTLGGGWIIRTVIGA